MMRIKKWTLLVVCIWCATNGWAQEAPLLSPLKAEEKSPFKGDSEGLELGMELTSELQTTKGGDLNFVNLLKLSAKLPVTNSVSIEATSLSTFMTAKESIGEDLQTFSNLDAGNRLFALSLCDVEWKINDRHTLYAGIRNMNEDYFTSTATSFFTNSSCGIYPTISANYPIANYPVASVGVHYRYEGASGSIGSNGSMSVQASLYNGTGYNRLFGRDNVFRICPKGDGIFALAQVEYRNNGSHYFLGNALYSNSGTSTTPWFYAEQRVNDRLTLLAGYSHAFSNDTECRDFAGLGLHYQHNKYGVGIFSDYANFASAEEYATEITCKVQISDHFYVQPSCHLIFTNQHSPATSSSFTPAASVRLGLCF